VTAIIQPALSHLRALEAEAIHVMREVAAEREKPALLFSGGKDSIVLVRLAQKAFAPGKVPFPLLHIDTGHNFPEVIEFRDRLVEENDLELLVGSVQASIDAGRVREETGPRASRNRLQTVTLLDAIETYELDACFGGARRDEERARAKERVLSFRDDFGPAPPAPRAVGPLQRARAPRREHPRVPDLQLDRARRVAVHRVRGARAAEHLHGPRTRGVRARRDAVRHRAVHHADAG
jgi:sulfate adenylyltransferase subunit 2